MGESSSTELCNVRHIARQWVTRPQIGLMLHDNFTYGVKGAEMGGGVHRVKQR